jgi:outer membrane receptor protein involved in Fe transport
MKSSKANGSMRGRPRRLRLAAAVALALGGPAWAQADLTNLSLEQLLQVSITGASKYEQRQEEIAAAASVITRQEIRAFGWRTLDDALASLPGLHVTYDRQYSYLGARGFGLPGDYNSRVLITINGNRLNDPIYDSAPTGRLLPLDLDLVERIEFIPGPGGAVYGQNAMFGVINLVTRSGSSVGGEVAAAYESPQALKEGRASWGGRLAGGTDLLLSVSGMQARGEDRLFDFGAAAVAGVAAGMDGERDRELFASARHGAWSFDFVYGDRTKKDPTGAYLADPLVPNQYQADRYAVGQVQYQDRLAGDRLQFTARLFAGREDYRSLLFYGGPYSFPATGAWRGGELRLLSTALAHHKLMVGLEGQDNVRENQFALDLTDPANDIAIRRTGYRYGAYVQDEWQVTDTLATTLGLRADRNSKTGTSTSPRAALIWRALPATTLKALYGRAHRAPNAFERDYDDGLAQVGNPTLRGERIDTAELVVDQRVGRDLALRASVFRWTLKNIITLGVDPVTGVPQYQSGLPVQADGVELSADHFWSGGMRVRGSVSLQDVSQQGGARLPNAPRVLAKLNASAPLPWAALRAGYELRYTSARRTLDGSEIGGFAVSNLALVADGWLRGLEATLSVHNLFDRRYDDPGADTNWQNTLEQDGRSLRVKLLYRF